MTHFFNEESVVCSFKTTFRSQNR